MSMLQNDVFSYSKVELPDPSTHIRLLRFAPQNVGNGINCTLHVFNRSEAPSYAAISYAWGDPVPTRSITVNGPPVLVGLNCHYALWQVRQQCLADYYWIDAICINQSDLHEKGCQVQFMGEIFSCADRVLVSVGAHTHESRFLRQNLEDAPLEPDRGVWEDWLRLVAKTMGKEHLANLGQALLLLSKRPYWNRIWIVQELILGCDILLLLGSGNLKWSLIEGLAVSLPDELMYYSSPTINYPGISEALICRTLSTIALAMQDRNSEVDAVGLIRLLGDFGGGFCSNILDRIYAFLALIDQSQPSKKRIIADYTKSSFELAMECLEHLEYSADNHRLDPMGQGSLIFRTLKVDSEEPHVQNMVERRMKSSRDVKTSGGDLLSYTVDSVTGAMASVKQDLPIPQGGCMSSDRGFLHYIEKRSILKLRQMEDGRLTGDFMNLAHPAAEYRRDIEEIDLIPDNTSQDLMYESFVAGLLCRQARPGDYLVRLNKDPDQGDQEPDTCLILRHYHQDIFQIIGQALLRPGESFCQGGRACLCDTQGGIKHTPQALRFDVHFEKEDLAALVAQDLATTKKSSGSSESGKASLGWSELQLRRLRVGVTRGKWSSFAIGLPG